MPEWPRPGSEVEMPVQKRRQAGGVPLVMLGTCTFKSPDEQEHPPHVTVCASPDGEEQTVLTYDPSARQFSLDRR